MASHVKGQLCIIMYPFQIKICRLHVLLNCMYADAFVFIRRKKKKNTSTEIQTVFEGNVLLFLRSQNIFEKKKEKKKPCKTLFLLM